MRAFVLVVLAALAAAAPAKSRLRAAFSGHKNEVMASAFFPDASRAVSTSDDKTIGLWDVRASARVALWEGHGGSVNAVAVSPDGKLFVTGGDEGTVKLWDARTREARATWTHGAIVNGVAFLDGGKTVLSAGDDKAVRVWDVRTGKQRAPWIGHDSGVMCLAVSSDGKRAYSGGRDGAVRVWDPATGRRVGGWTAHAATVFAASLSRDGATLVTGGGDGAARAWDASTGKERFAWKGAGAIVPAAAVSPDGRRALTGDDLGTARLYDLATGKEAASWKAHEGTVFSASFSSDGKLLLTTGWDGAVKVWDAADHAGGAPETAAKASLEEEARAVLARLSAHSFRRPVPPATDAQRELGRRLFFDPRLSRDGSVSCASCHQPEKAWGDGRARARGIDGKVGPRNTPSLLGVRYSPRLRWDGAVATIEEAALIAIESPVEMGQTREGLARALASYPGVTADDATQALAAFVATIGAPEDSAFDRFARGEKNALTPAALEGLALFAGKARCLRCHTSSDFADTAFHRTGLKASDTKDAGRYAVDPRTETREAFRTPPLRNVALTAPYMHDGRFKTLREVVDFYDRGGDGSADSEDIAPLGLTSKEKAAVVAFLESLTTPQPSAAQARSSP